MVRAEKRTARIADNSRYILLISARSSNGRTLDFGSSNRGSSPRRASILLRVWANW